MKLLTETSKDLEVLIEDTGKNQNLFIKGIFMQAEMANKNGRIYPRHILERELGKYQKAIKEGKALGELGHPQNPTINLERASHLITDMKFENNNIIGKAKIIGTPMGNIAKSLLESGVKLGVSSRGVGTLVAKNGINEVQDDFRLSTVDIVADPSAPDAWVDSLTESVDWLIDESTGEWKKIDGNIIRKRLQEEKEKKALIHLKKFLARL